MNCFLLDRYIGGTCWAIFLFVLTSCIDNVEPKRNAIIKTEYPNLADEMIERDFDGLWLFTDYENEFVRALSYNAIRKSKANDLQFFTDYAIQEDDSLVWQALSSHPLTDNQVDSIGQKFVDGTIKSESVCNVFFQHGTRNTLEILLESPELLMQSEVCSKAGGGIVAKIQVDDSLKEQIVDLAFESDNEIIWRNLLYGFYRSDLNRPAAESALNDRLISFLKEHGDQFTFDMDRYIVRILGKAGFFDVMERRSDRALNKAIQLSNELARNIISFDREELTHPGIKRLLSHSVDNVVTQLLQSLHEFDSIPEELLYMIEFEIAPITWDAEIFAEALTVLSQNQRDIGGYRTKLEFMDEENEYLKHKMLPLYAEIESDDEYLNRLRGEISEGGIGGLRAMQALMNYFTENTQDPGAVEKVRSLTRFVLEEGDQSVISTIDPLLRNKNLFAEDSYEWLMNHYENFIETSQWEKASVLEEMFSDRFPDQFEALEIPEKPFQIPNWERLYEMGTNPFWVLETEKGMIEIRLDPLSAPFTVSSIDSLTRAGEYDDVPFHRLVRNFVIQGGDIERQDGYGGTDYKLPTEPSLNSFERGMVGIASSGTDTEGSQYFVMLNWSPHLDGNYTIFGEVTKGMDVADRMQVGDRVVKVEIYPK